MNMLLLIAVTSTLALILLIVSMLCIAISEKNNFTKTVSRIGFSIVSVLMILDVIQIVLYAVITVIQLSL